MPDIGGVIFAGLRGDAKIGTQESGTEFCNKLFAGVAFIAEALTAEVTVKAALMLCPVRELVRFGGGVALGVLEGFRDWKLDRVGGGGVIGSVSAMAEGCAGRSKESLGILDEL